MGLLLAWTVLASDSIAVAQPLVGPLIAAAQAQLADGDYPVQQASYNDATGEYTLFLLNASPATFRTTDLPMARLTSEETAQGKSSYLQVQNHQPALHLSEDFKIEYFHAITETQTNPQTGQPQTVIVRRESSFWTPFAGAIAGQMVANLLFTPHYYVPPLYQPGIPLTGYGGFGSTYNQAVDRYQSRYQAPPPAVQNRTTLRTTGRLNSPRSTTLRRPRSTTQKPTGSGFGSSTLRSSGQSSPSRAKSSPSRFGSGRSSRPTAGFGSRRSFSRRR